LLRPLLGAARADVLAHLRLRSLEWLEDASNDDPRFARNRVRHDVLPQIEKHMGSHARRSLARAATLLADDDNALEARAARLFARIVRRQDVGLVLPIAALRRAPIAVARRLVRRGLRHVGGLRGVGAIHVERILKLAGTAAPSGRRVSLPGRREASFRFDSLYLGPRVDVPPAFTTALSVPGYVELPDGRALTACAAEGPERREPGVAVLALDAPLEVRNRRAGDRVRVRGRERSLKRVLMEARVPAELRGSWPVVTAAGQVVWVPGLELGPPRAAAGQSLVRLELLEAALREVRA
jgi:tRNA(Ile)-lysidine synthase